MGVMVFDCVGLLQIVVHDDGPPDHATWTSYLEQSRQLLERAAADHAGMTALIISDRGVPSTEQRAEFLRLLNGRQVPVALISRSVLIRAVVASVNLFNPAMRSFSPDKLTAALSHVGVDPARHRELHSSLRRLAPRIPTAKTLREIVDGLSNSLLTA
jgi:hypothetical protein